MCDSLQARGGAVYCAAAGYTAWEVGEWVLWVARTRAVTTHLALPLVYFPLVFVSFVRITDGDAEIAYVSIVFSVCIDLSRTAYIWV